MLQAFIVTLREGVEAALIVGITLAYLAKIGRPELRKSVYAGLVAAFVGSIAVAVLVSRFHLNQDIVEGWVMLAAAFFVITMIIFMMRTGKKMKKEIESKLDNIAARGSQAGIFLFVFLMIMREGVETVLTLAGATLDSTALMEFLGTFFRVTTVILCFVAAQLVISGLHELSENGVLPSSKREMALIGPIVSNQVFFYVTILALAALMVLFEVKSRQPMAEAASPAERRKATWSARRERLWMASVYVSSFIFIMLVTAEFIYAKSLSAPQQAAEVTFVSGQVAIPLTQVQDGDLHFYQAKENGVAVRFWLYQKPDGKIATVLDACEICGSVGFYKGTTGVVCKNCAAPINPQSVGMAGGCNPIPLQAETTSDAVIIKETDVAAGSRFFKP